MKRTRDDMSAGSQIKRPFDFSSRGESYGQPNVPGVGMGGAGAEGSGGGAVGISSQKLTTNDALTYLKEVKEMFKDQREKYDMFLEVMKDFKAQRTDTAGVIARVKELFKGHSNLIYGFNTFLPKGYEITLDEDEVPPKKAVDFKEAIGFVNKIKTRFQHDEHVYKSFLDILDMYRKEHKDISEIYGEVAALFEDHRDLLEEFTRFLPDTSTTPIAQQGPIACNQAVHYNGRSSGTLLLRKMHVDKQCRWDKSGAFQHGNDLSIRQPESEDDKRMSKMQDQRKHMEKNDRDRQHDKDAERFANRGLDLQYCADERKSTRGGEGFRAHSSHVFCDDKGGYQQAFVFCEKVKERLCNQDDYQAFLKCLDIFSNGIIKRNDLQNLVNDLLGKHPDLMADFNQFVEHCENIGGFLTGVMNKRSLYGDGSSTVNLEDRERERKRGMEGAKEKEKCKEKYLWKSIQELDLSGCERCTPSYRLLPDDYPIPIASQRTELGAEVLNDHWVSVTSGSEDYSFKHMRKNQYEESLFRCEDDRFELDLLLESVSSTAKRAEDLLKSINDNKLNRDNPIRIDDYFSAINLRCIERLYGDHGLDVMDILRKTPAIALPVILARLKQKYEEWLKCREDFNKVWADIYEKNHYKSLDHRSFYFKQQDSKYLNAKALVAEINELKAKMRKEDDVYLSVAAGHRQPIVPHIEYVYSDASIHEDLYKLVYFSCEEVCSTKEQLDKIMRLWTTFLEPMLGFFRSKNVNDADDAGKVKPANIAGYPSVVDANDKRAGDSVQFKAVGGGENASLGLSRSNGIDGTDDCTSKEIPVDANYVCKDDGTRSSQLEHNMDESYKWPGKSTQLASELVTNVSASHSAGAEKSSGKSDIALKSGSCGVRSLSNGDLSEDCQQTYHCESGPISKVGDNASLVAFAIGADGNRIDGHNESIQLSKVEKEEGELSPNGDFEEEDTCGGCKDADVKLTSSLLHFENSQYHSSDGEGLNSLGTRVENGADADDGSENPTEAGDVGSGSESAADECSQEKHREEKEKKDTYNKVESESEGDGVVDAHDVRGDGMSLFHSNRRLSSMKPLAKYVQVVGEKRKDSRVFFGSDDFYVLFRLHQILYDRILSAKTECASPDSKWKSSKDAEILDGYSSFMRALCSLLDGSEDNTKFEDECRSLIGNHSYTLFTLDKLIYKLVKQLQAVVAEDTDSKLLQLYEYERSRKPEKLVDSVYHENARVLLHEDNIYRLEFSSSPSRLSAQLMDNVIEKPEAFAVSMDPTFSSYLHNDFLSVFTSREEPHGLMLHRNKRKFVGLDGFSATCKAMEGTTVINGLECKISCKTYKTSYVLDTEDIFYRKKRRDSSQGRSTPNISIKGERFNKFLLASR